MSDSNLETGTLAELNVKPGDLVEWVGANSRFWEKPRIYKVQNDGVLRHQDGGFISPKCKYSDYRIVYRATKLWRDMTDGEKSALLLAHYKGWVIEWFNFLDEEWVKVSHPSWRPDFAYRVKPEPKTVTLHGNADGSTWLNFGIRGPVKFDTHRITFDLIDGKPDLDSIKMEKL